MTFSDDQTVFAVGLAPCDRTVVVDAGELEAARNVSQVIETPHRAREQHERARAGGRIID